LKKLLSILLLFLVTLPLANLSPVKAQHQYYVNISRLEDYYIKGDSLNIQVTTNASNYLLQIYLPNSKLWLSQSYPANTTQTFTIPSNAPYGTYTVKAIAGNSTATTWFTILDVSDWKPTVFPYSRKHKNVEYTFYSNGTFRAEGSNGNFTLNFGSLVKLAKTHGLTVSATYNSMNFRARFYKAGTDIDINMVFSFIWKGCKFIVHGTIDREREFSFNLSRYKGELKSFVDCVRSGNLVFDWSDLRKAKHKFEYDKETKVLTVSVPTSFNLDPYIFEDGFESGDFSAWDGTGTSSADSEITVQSNVVHTGSYAANATRVPYDQNSLAYKHFTSTYYSLYARGYFYLDELNLGSGYRTALMRLSSYVGDYVLGAIEVYNDGGTVKWRVSYRNSSSSIYQILGSPYPQLDTWYCLEIYVNVDSTSGEFKAWIDGTERYSISGLNNSDGGKIYTLRVGAIATSGGGVRKIYFDDCVVDDSYIGTLSSNNAPTIGEFQAPSTVYANQWFYLNASVNDADGISEIVNATIELSNSVILKWDNASATFSEYSDTNNYCTLNASACIETEKNGTAFKLSWRIKLNNYPSGTINILSSNTKVWDSSTSGSNNKTGLFTFSYITLNLQARDSSGTNLPHSVTFSGTLGNGTSFTKTSNTNGLATLTTCYGTHTVNIWWGTHLVGSTSTSVTSSPKTVDINTKIRRVTYGSNYLLASLNNTDLPSPTVVSGTEVKFVGATATGTIQLKLDVSNWKIQDEPVKVKVGTYTYERGAAGWNWDSTNKIWAFNIHFSTQDIIIYWEEATTSGGSYGGTQTVPAEPEEEETGEGPTVPAQPTIPESYVIYKPPAVDTTMVVVVLIVVCAVVYLANHYLNNYGSVSKLWRKKLNSKKKVKWKR